MQVALGCIPLFSAHPTVHLPFHSIHRPIVPPPSMNGALTLLAAAGLLWAASGQPTGKPGAATGKPAVAKPKAAIPSRPSPPSSEWSPSV